MSIINHKFNHIFIHIPKTAGHSMELSPFIGGNMHETIHQLSLKEDFNPDYFKWSFVRNPYTRIISGYFYAKDFNKDLFKDYEGDTFKDFVMNYKNTLSDIKDDSSNGLWFPQTYFLESENTKLDFIGRFENLAQDWIFIVRKILNNGKTCALKHWNKTYDNHMDNYTKEIKDTIYNIYKEDFDTYNYEK